MSATELSRYQQYCKDEVYYLVLLRSTDWKGHSASDAASRPTSQNILHLLYTYKPKVLSIFSEKRHFIRVIRSIKLRWSVPSFNQLPSHSLGVNTPWNVENMHHHISAQSFHYHVHKRLIIPIFPYTNDKLPVGISNYMSAYCPHHSLILIAFLIYQYVNTIFHFHLH
jgi:hypothetical protein